MIEVTLGAATVGRVRLAASPAFDTIAWLGLCADGRADPVFGSPDAAARSALADADVALLAAVLPPGGHGYLPDFLTPKPGRDAHVLEHQLDEVAATDPADVHRQVAVERFGARAMPPDVARSVGDGSFARRAARAVAVFWRAGLAESWSRLGQLLATDIALRSQTVSQSGVAAMLGQLHPRIECDGQTLRVDIPWHEQHRYDDVELVVSPSLFGSPAVSAQLCSPDQAVLRYPATATGAARTQPAPEAVAALMGATRAALLTDLDVPRSTRALSGRCRLAPATVSYHLGVLLDCGLVARMRQGHTVLYLRSARGDLLLS